IVSCPLLSSRRRSREQLGIAARQDELAELWPDDRRRQRPELARERVVEKPRSATPQLGLRERQQRDHLHATGKALGHARQREQTRGPGQKDPPRAPVVIDSALDRPQQFWRALPLVERYPVERAQNPSWVEARRGKDRVVIEREVRAMPAD